MNRTLNVIRMQLVNRQTFVWIPLIILGASLLMSLAIYGVLSSAGIDEVKIGGGAQAPLWYFFAVGLQSLTLTFPFSQAMSVTRRDFFLGTLLTAGLTSAILAVVFLIGGYVEEFTNGWGMNGWFFRIPWVWEGGPLVALLFFFAVAMLLFVIGFWGATTYKRFGPLGLTIVLVGLGVLVVGAFWLIANTNAWGPVFGGIAQLGALGLALWTLVATAVLSVASFLMLRRAIP